MNSKANTQIQNLKLEKGEILTKEEIEMFLELLEEELKAEDKG
jgi:hypothetical protein